MARSDPFLDREPTFVGEFQDDPGTFMLWVGENTARVVYDGGDGRLTPEFVTAAVQRTRELRFSHFPLQEEYAVIGAAYFNSAYDAVRYEHPDHRAVHVALWTTDQGVPGPQWCRTPTADPDVAGTGGRTDVLTPDTYLSAMAVDSVTRQRTGIVQAAYGWLAPDDGWARGETDSTAIFSRRQSFWRRFG